MKVSVAVKRAENLVPDRFSEADELRIVDVDNMFVVESFCVDNPEGRDAAFAKKTIEWDCEAIICGQMDKAAFEIVADACVTRYLGTGHETMEAVEMMQAYKLPLIREYDGGPGCGGAEAWHRMTGHTDAGCGCEEPETK